MTEEPSEEKKKKGRSVKKFRICVLGPSFVGKS